MNIPYSLPLIDKDVIAEVNDALTNTGWITSGPKVFEFEDEIRKLTQADAVVCVNSWVSGAMLMLRWFGVGSGDEVIIPAYTYSATALACMNMGAKPIMVDVNDDFTINIEQIRTKINEHTKVIIPVDIAGLPCDYKAINTLVDDIEIKSLFKVNSPNQKKLGRILIVADAAHSIGATVGNVPVGALTDITIFSFHSVKNITTGEGGAICLKLPEMFDIKDEYQFLKALSLNGQTKSAFQKNQLGGWKYDIIAQGLKVNMTDMAAAIGLAQIRKYKNQLLPERKAIADFYSQSFSSYDWAVIPTLFTPKKESSYHLYLLRIKDITEKQRDEMIQYISERQVGVNVHYTPMPMLTLFKEKDYNINDYPNTYRLYANEISLPLYNGLNKKQQQRVIDVVVEAYKAIS